MRDDKHLAIKLRKRVKKELSRKALYIAKKTSFN